MGSAGIIPVSQLDSRNPQLNAVRITTFNMIPQFG
jgi:hypothetical protein